MRAKITILTIMATLAFLAGPCLGADEKGKDWVDTGLTFISRQQYDNAIKAFSTAIEIIPRDYQAYNYRGVAWALKGDFDRAVADYDKALELRPRYTQAYNNRGFAHTQKGDLQRALADYSRALELNPFFVDAYNNKAWILATAADKRYRNAAKAVMLAQKAVELKPDVTSFDTLAAAYAAAGKFEAAIDTQKKAIQKLLMADQASEVAIYMPHLNSYRSRQSLRISYSAAHKASKAKKLKVSLKTKTKEKQTQLSKTKQIVTASHPQKAVSAARTKARLLPAAPLPYTIQVSAFRDLQKSNQVATELMTKGDRAFTCPVQISGKGKWYRVYIGYYKTLEEARTAAADLKKRKFRYVNITKKPYAVQVGLVGSAKKAQELKARLQAKGYLAYTLPARARSNQTRILIGAYSSKKEAANLENQLREDGFRAKVLPR